MEDYLGIEKVIWLESGIAGDDTDGHVDDVARFVGKNTIMCMVESDPDDENYEPLKRNYELLEWYNHDSQEKLTIVPIEMPKSVVLEENRLPASYANFYIGNSAVLLPVFGDEERDRKAVLKLSRALSESTDCPYRMQRARGRVRGHSLRDAATAQLGMLTKILHQSAN